MIRSLSTGRYRGMLACAAVLLLAGCRTTRLPNTDFRQQAHAGEWGLRHQALEVLGGWSGDEGAIDLRAGQLESKPFAVVPQAWYRLTVTARGPAPFHCAAVFLDAANRQLRLDHYDLLEPTAVWGESSFCFRGHADAARAFVRIVPPAEERGVQVRRVRVERVSPAEVTAWADSLAPAVPAPEYDPPADRFRYLPRAQAVLRGGGTLRIVCLGDSIMSDLSTGPWDALLARRLPGVEWVVIPSVRGGTGCWYFEKENRVEEFVLRHRPDLVLIGGISTDNNVEAVRNVVRQIRAKSGADVLLLTGAVAPLDLPDYRRRLTAAQLIEERKAFDVALARVADEDQVAFLDLRRAWDACVAASGRAPDYFRRDWIHANSRGRLVLARVLEAYLTPE